MISPALTERILEKLGVARIPSLDLPGLNNLFTCYCKNVPNDNLQKRIWLAGNRSGSVTGGRPEAFFENWLAHGTGGTCFPLNGGLAALLLSIGFDAKRASGSVVQEGLARGGNHGTVIVRISGKDYLADAQMCSMKVLPLHRDRPSKTDTGIHEISAWPIEGGLEVRWFTGLSREVPTAFRLEDESVTHQAFLSAYERSVSVEGYSPFNRELFICRHFEQRILALRRTKRYDVDASGRLAKTELGSNEKKRVLVEELGISAEIVGRLPPDEDAS